VEKHPGYPQAARLTVTGDHIGVHSSNSGMMFF